MGTGLAYYHAIGTYSVHVQYMYSWAQPILGCISRFGRFAGIAEIISEIVNLGVNLGSSGYFPMLRLLTVQYSTAVCHVVAAPLGGRWVFLFESLSVRSRCGSVRDHGMPSSASMFLARS